MAAGESHPLLSFLPITLSLSLSPPSLSRCVKNIDLKVQMENLKKELSEKEELILQAR